MTTAATLRPAPFRPESAVPIHSAMFPIRGAARGSDVDYGLALAFVAARHDVDARAAQKAIVQAHGGMAFLRFSDLIHKAVADGRLRVVRWTRGGA